jgi:hypothetical protein
LVILTGVEIDVTDVLIKMFNWRQQVGEHALLKFDYVLAQFIDEVVALALLQSEEKVCVVQVLDRAL